jgi:hypothetical protein
VGAARLCRSERYIGERLVQVLTFGARELVLLLSLQFQRRRGETVSVG